MATRLLTLESRLSMSQYSTCSPFYEAAQTLREEFTPGARSSIEGWSPVTNYELSFARDMMYALMPTHYHLITRAAERLASANAGLLTVSFVHREPGNEGACGAVHARQMKYFALIEAAALPVIAGGRWYSLNRFGTLAIKDTQVPDEMIDRIAELYDINDFDPARAISGDTH